LASASSKVFANNKTNQSRWRAYVKVQFVQRLWLL